MRPLLDRVASLKPPRLFGAAVLDQGWVVIRIRRVSPQRYRIRVRQPSVPGRHPRVFLATTVWGWETARRVLLIGIRDAIEWEARHA
jgi:hypothetical protein